MTVTFVARLEYHSQLLIRQFSPVGIPILFETGKNCLKELDSLVDELLSKRSVRLSVTPRILFKNFSYDEQRYDRNIPMISCDIHVCPFTIELWQAILGFLWSPEWLLFSHAIFRHQVFFWMTLRFCFHEGFGFAFQHEITRTSIKNIMDNAQYCVSRDERQSNNLSFGTRPFTLRNGWRYLRGYIRHVLSTNYFNVKKLEFRSDFRVTTKFIGGLSQTDGRCENIISYTSNLRKTSASKVA